MIKIKVFWKNTILHFVELKCSLCSTWSIETVTGLKVLNLKILTY